VSVPRRFHEARWDEPIVLEMGSPGERGYVPPAVEPAIADAVGDAASIIPPSMRSTTPPR
jgi:glycine dehydrogenase subunit 2